VKWLDGDFYRAEQEKLGWSEYLPCVGSAHTITHLMDGFKEENTRMLFLMCALGIASESFGFTAS
jgi:hypothetical protein